MQSIPGSAPIQTPRSPGYVEAVSDDHGPSQMAARPTGSTTGRTAGRRDYVEALVLTVVLVGFVVVSVAAYFAMPVAQVEVASVWLPVLLIVLALALMIGLYVVTLRGLRNARHPMWRAATLAAVLSVVFVLGFAYVYLAMQTRSPGEVPGISTHLDALYFSVALIATVGFGDIAPTGQAARAVATVQMVFGLVFIGFLVRTAIQAGRQERQRRDEDHASKARWHEIGQE